MITVTVANDEYAVFGVEESKQGECPWNELTYKGGGSYTFPLDWTTLCLATGHGEAAEELHALRLGLLAALVQDPAAIPHGTKYQRTTDTFDVNGTTNLDSDIDVTVLKPNEYRESRGFVGMLSKLRQQKDLDDMDMVTWNVDADRDLDVLAFLRSAFDFDLYVTNFSRNPVVDEWSDAFVRVRNAEVAINEPSDTTLAFARLRLDATSTPPAPPALPAGANIVQRNLHRIGTATLETRDQYHTASAYIFTALGDSALSTVNEDHREAAYEEVVWENLGFAKEAIENLQCPTVESKAKKLFKYVSRASNALAALGDTDPNRDWLDATSKLRGNAKVDWRARLRNWNPGTKSSDNNDSMLPHIKLESYIEYAEDIILRNKNKGRGHGHGGRPSERRGALYTLAAIGVAITALSSAFAASFSGGARSAPTRAHANPGVHRT